MDPLCREHAAICASTKTKEDLGFDEFAASVYWGAFSYGEIELPSVELAFPGGQLTAEEIEIRIGVACYEHDRCAEDLPTCGGVVLHEIGHQKAGADQTAADCWAARSGADLAYIDALVTIVCSFGDEPRCEAIEDCACEGRDELCQ